MEMEDYFSKLEKKIEGSPNFSEEEVEVLRSLIRVYRGIAGIKIVGSWIVALLVATSAGFVAWATILERFKE